MAKLLDKKDNNGIPKEDQIKKAQKNTGNQERIQGGGDWGNRSPKKTAKVTSFTMILYTLENSFRDVRSFCRLLFGHSSIVKISSSHL